MGPTNRIPASSHIYTSYGSSTDQIIERMTNLAFTNDLKFEKPKMVWSRTLAYLGISEDEIPRLKKNMSHVNKRNV